MVSPTVASGNFPVGFARFYKVMMPMPIFHPITVSWICVFFHFLLRYLVILMLE